MTNPLTALLDSLTDEQRKRGDWIKEAAQYVRRCRTIDAMQEIYWDTQGTPAQPNKRRETNK